MGLKNLRELNMSVNGSKVVVCSFPLDIMTNKVMKRLEERSRLIQPSSVDYLDNEGYVSIDANMQVVLTGCQATALILYQMTRINPKYIEYPIYQTPK